MPANWTWASSPSDDIDTVMVDIDGVLADGMHRQRYLDGEDADWQRFNEASINDSPVASMITLVRSLRADHTIALVTARPMWVNEDTRTWLERHGVRWDVLIMRETGSELDAPAFKARSLEELVALGYRPVLAFDDDPRNVAMYEAHGVPCLYIHSGYYGIEHL